MTTKVINIVLNVAGARGSATALDRDLKNINKTVRTLTTDLTYLSKSIAAVFAVRELVRFSDAWTTVGNKIRQASASIQEFEALQARVFEIAKSGRSEVEGVALSFQRIDNAVKELGYSQADVLDVVDGLTKALKSNGQTAQEVSSVLIQLSQAFAKGRLDGDELRSVMEASLPISKAIAASFGINVGQLKDFGEQGKLVSETVFKGLIAALPEFQAAFDKSIPTISDSFTVLGNSVKRFIGEFNELTGLSNSVSKAILDIANAFDFLSETMESGSIITFGDIFYQQTIRALDAFNNLENNTGITFDKTKLAAEAWSEEITKFISDAFLNAIPNVSSFVQILTIEFLSAKDKVGAVLDNIFSFDNQKEKETKIKQAFAVIDEIRADLISGIMEQNEVEKQLSEEGLQRAKLKRLEYLAELEFNKELLKLERERTANIQTGPTEKDKKRISGSESKLEKNLDDSIFKSDMLLSDLNAENSIIENALKDRINIYKQYGTIVNDIWASEYDRRIAQIEINAALEKSAAQKELDERLKGNQERSAKILEDEMYSEYAKQEAIRELKEQNLLYTQEYEQQLTEIEANARLQRITAALEEERNVVAMQNQIQQTYLDTAQIGIGALINLIGGSKKAGKALRLLQAGISAYQVYASSQAAAWMIRATPPGPVMNPSLEVLARATEIKGGISAAAIMAAAAAETFSGGGSSGGGISGGGSVSQPAPQLPQAPETVQSLSIVGNEELVKQLEELSAADGQIPARIMLRYLNSIEAAKRIGAS